MAAQRPVASLSRGRQPQHVGAGQPEGKKPLTALLGSLRQALERLTSPTLRLLHCQVSSHIPQPWQSRRPQRLCRRLTRQMRETRVAKLECKLRSVWELGSGMTLLRMGMKRR